MAAVSPVKQLLSTAPFSSLGLDVLAQIEESSELVRYELGARLLTPKLRSPGLLVLLQGEVRILSTLSNQRTITLDRRGPGQMMGWVSLLRGESCELIQASEPCVCLLIPSDSLVSAWRTSEEFLQFFLERSTPSELSYVLLSALSDVNAPPADEESWLRQAVSRVQLHSGSSLNTSDTKLAILSSAVNPQSGLKIGQQLYSKDEAEYPENSITGFPRRQILCPSFLFQPYQRDVQDFDSHQEEHTQNSESQAWLDSARPAKDVLASISTIEELGIVSAEDLSDQDIFSARTGSTITDQVFASLQNLSERLQLPFPKDRIQRLLSQQFKRRGSISLELLALLCEGMGLQSHIGIVRKEQLHALEWPAFALSIDNKTSRPLLLHGWKNSQLIVADSSKGLINISPGSIIPDSETSVRILLVKRTSTTAVDRFGWSWFTPLLSKYKVGLLIVLLATFATQLATLAIPLLMQQIIDKTLSQGNISSLNVLGAALVTIALFQSLMTALRTFVFKDTADRMDLQLGATVIDRLLRLPLPFFDKRPVGELSQRLGEMNSIRNFLTGTAITSLMDIVFSIIYLVVMVLYSPLLTAVALSTFPLYVTLVFIVAPLYKSLIRKQAVAQAKTQSHVIEVLSAIQTVKAQNVETMSRWKWQDRYQGVVEQGFKAVTVGTVSGQIGSFLNTLSSLLILWVGMIQVIEGKITLGQLIAFRIISGYVTGPLLRLSNLYQSFQKVSLSFERLGDIINQQPEAISDDDQIALPPIEGEVRYESLSFRFNKTGPLILDNVDLHIQPGQFVGIAGLSGSGKSTLMKLLGRLYEPLSGRIVVDGYDISKIDLSSLRQQIGIVPQESLLFEGTVRDNLTLGRPEADNDDIIAAAKVACAHDFIMDLPDGYNTFISEKGSNLSGGQRQRLSIARTLLAEPCMLVMDEATSALDYQTEAQVCANLRVALKGRTVFFITHRLGTIRHADKIILMHQGRVVEQGEHRDLMDSKGRYYALYRQQQAGAEE
jgi:ATP-binding cassette subfamily B protein